MVLIKYILPVFILFNSCSDSNSFNEFNGSWIGKCNSDLPCEIYFDENKLFFYNERIGVKERTIEWRSKNEIYILEDPQIARINLKNSAMEIIFSESMDTFLLNKSKFEYHPIDSFCINKLTKECTSCIESGFMLRFYLQNNSLFNSSEEWDQYLDEQENLFQVNGYYEMKECWTSLRGFYFK